ncbi:hypothetical protein Cgig2_025409 [Carnegiea gigantea]|uniref:Sel1-like protein n=1 Tax=Carnegiea gigantea TaxID=171969 RepID=A0A9Q1K0U0_9CARY|nr:hypothetical protein Cgig2_025409 [Carnegiea gigantea]
MNLYVQSSRVLLPQSRNLQSLPYKHIKKIPPLFVNNSPTPLFTDFLSLRRWVNRSRTLRRCITLPEIISSERINTPKQAKPMSKNKVSYSFSQENSQLKVARVDLAHLSLKTLDSVDQTRVPLSQVVSDCVKRWFQDTLKEAKAGDSAMRLLVGQMYNSGYGVNKDTETGRAWITKALKSRSSAFKSSNKQPGLSPSC